MGEVWHSHLNAPGKCFNLRDCNVALPDPSDGQGVSRSFPDNVSRDKCDMALTVANMPYLDNVCIFCVHVHAGCVCDMSCWRSVRVNTACSVLGLLRMTWTSFRAACFSHANVGTSNEECEAYKCSARKPFLRSYTMRNNCTCSPLEDAFG